MQTPINKRNLIKKAFRSIKGFAKPFFEKESLGKESTC
jgi:hypothetical protein